jgi:hypothetical protein
VDAGNLSKFAASELANSAPRRSLRQCLIFAFYLIKAAALT